MTKELSDKFRICTSLCTIMVVYRHSMNFIAFFDAIPGDGLALHLQSNVSMISDLAVPFFFIISGFFFFKKDYYQKNEYVMMIGKKSKSLLLPFLFWNLVWAPIYIYNSNNFNDISIKFFLQKLWVSDFYGPLWYVRDLILAMVLVPLYGYVFRMKKWYLYVLMMVSLFFCWDVFNINTIIFFMFPLGGVLSKYENILTYKAHYLLLFILGIIWFFLYSMPVIFGYSFPYRYAISVFLSIIIFWNIIDYIPHDFSRILLKYSCYSFFIYVTHFYVIKVFKIILGREFQGNTLVSVVAYIFLPLIFIPISICIAQKLKAKYSRFYQTVMGGR